MIEIRDMDSGYDGKNVLNGINMQLPRGKVTMILGPNGCGKTTLLKNLVKINEKHSGEILIDGVNIDSMTQKELAQRVAYLSQNKHIPEITVDRLVLHGRFPYLSYPRRYRREDMNMVIQSLNRMGISDLADKPVSMLSGGTRQKVYIAMALAQDTPVILMDEPTSFLDISYQLQLMAISRELASSGKTVVMVLHDIALAMQYADYLVLMSEGRVICQGCPEEVFVSGFLDRIFGVAVERVWTEQGWRYYYTK